MISIKRFLDQRRNNTHADQDLLEASLQASRLLIEGLATHLTRGRDADVAAFRRTLQRLMRRMEDPPSAMGLLDISNEAVEALETYAAHTAAYLRDENEQVQSMVALLTETLSDLSGQSEEGFACLQAIEQRIERASGVDDLHTLRAGLEACLQALRDSKARQRNGAAGTVQRLKDRIGAVRERMAPPGAPAPPDREDTDCEPEPVMPRDLVHTAYVGVFKLRRAEHIASRFGEDARQQMLSVISQSLRTVLNGDDRLLRWKGTSFVMFLKTTATIQEVRKRLLAAVNATGQQYVDLGRNSALLSVGVDWTVFPETPGQPLAAVFAEVDAFLANGRPGLPPAVH